MHAFAEWLSRTAPSVAIQSTFWLIRLLQATHLIAAGVVAVSGLMIALRVLGVQRADQSFDTVWARFAPWLFFSLALQLLTGLAQTLGDPVRELTATSYWVKVALVLCCIVGTLLLSRAGDSFFLFRGEARGRGADTVLARDPDVRPNDRLRQGDLGRPVAAHMSTRAILEGIEASALGNWMRYTNGAMPIVESTHVLAAVLLLGTVLIVDLRLLGIADSSQAFTRVARETLRLTWLAFAVSVITGSLMFTTSAVTYFGNTAFRLKALALFAAGLNMAVFQLLTARGVAVWNDDAAPPPRAARVAGLLSLLLWAAVVLLGRWIGFTKGYDFTVPADVELSFPG